MKLRSLLLATTFLGMTAPAFATPLHVQSVSGNAGSAASVSFTLPTAIAVGDTFVGEVFEESSSNVISSIVDDKGNTYSLLDVKQSGTNPYFVQSFALAKITNGPQTITVNFSSMPTGGVQYIWGDEYSGVASIDTHNLTYTASGTSFPSGSVTLAGTNDLLWTGAAPGGSGITVPSGYTARINDTADGLFSADLAFTGTGAYAGASYTNGASESAIVGIIGLVPVAPAPSIDMSDGSHLAPSVEGDVVGVSSGAFTLVAPQAGPAGPAGPQGPAGQNAGQNTYPACPAPTDASTVGNSEFCSANGHTDIAVSPAANTWVYFGPASATAP